ncbi:MAG TPA: short-chain dehydrogenase [Cyanobacteria bacterium UBA11162]|nr:short-chain dehydrogenase [Cyanobacteria bacterium UBA11162]
MEPIAIIGIGCRLPGAKDPESFWQLLRNGVDAITEVPKDRWDIDAFYDPEPGKPGKMSSRWGGFLERVDQFDPSFFGISPREVERMDPQQRLVLEVAWEALENAGLPADQISGTQTGVFIGIGNYDYCRLLAKDISLANAYDGTGNTLSITANRLSYILNLRGPSAVIETACSSSLVALHFACRSLQSRESNLFIVGGVSLMVVPETTITYSHARMMASDGRCKTFDASADGYVRGEGCGVIVLKRLSDAIASQDNILAVIKGSAVNQDGLSNGLTAPNGPSQQEVISQALENAGVTPAEISYIEAHGTGTSLGDPIEFRSLKTVLMKDRKPDQPCWLGSVKTNIGHLEAAAGVTGIIKVVLSLQHQEIPPHLHFKQLNPLISLEGTTFSIPTQCQPWSVKRRLAGISGFGFGGTNCHVILEEAPSGERGDGEMGRWGDGEMGKRKNKNPKSKIQNPKSKERPFHILTLSAKSEKALRELAQRYADFLVSHPEVSLADICFTANTGRSHFDYRLAVVADSTAQLQEQLEAFATGKETVGLVRGQLDGTDDPNIAFLFTGQGSQYIGMGRQLYETQPIFRQVLNRCDQILRPYLEQPLLDVLYPEPGSSSITPRDTSPPTPLLRGKGSNTLGGLSQSDPNTLETSSLLDQTAYTQPALFALEYALFQLWKSWGIEPSIVMGHSVGEYTAACVAGVFSLEEGLKLIAERARLMQALPQDGEMVAVFASESKVQAVIQPYAQDVSIAAINGLQSIVISGKREVVESAIATLKAEGIKTKKLTVSHAFHSPLMEPMLAAFRQVAASTAYSVPKIKFISNVSGKLATHEVTNPEYWCRHVRLPVKFAASMATLQQQDCQLFVEIGPKPILLGMGRHCIPEDTGIWLPSLYPGRNDWQQLLQSLGALYVRGVAVDWGSFDQDYPRRRLQLPTYPFQRQRYWVEFPENGHSKVAPLSLEDTQTPLANLLAQGDTQELATLLATTGKLSNDELKFLPKLLDLLVQENQEQVRVASIKDWLYEVEWQSKPRLTSPGENLTPQPPSLRGKGESGSPVSLQAMGGRFNVCPSLREKGEFDSPLLQGDCSNHTINQENTQSKGESSSPLLVGEGLGERSVPGSWLPFADRGGVGESLAQLLRDRTHHCILVYPGDTYQTLDPQTWRINPANPADFERLLQDSLGRCDRLQGIIHLWSLEAGLASQLTIPTLEQAQAFGVGSVLHLLQALVQKLGTGKESSPSLPRLWLVTRGAVPLGSQLPGVAQAPLWGLGKVVALEYPEFWGGMLDLAPDAPDDEVTQLVAEIEDAQGEDHLAFRDGQRYVTRLVHKQLPASQKLTFQPDATYLITGGLGALGLRIAQWMVEQGAKQLVLTGRSGASSQAQETISQLKQLGAKVAVARVDVCNEGDTLRMLEGIEVSMPPLRGIIHAAGISRYETLQEMDVNILESVLRPKVVGAWILHQLTQGIALDFFINFSSISSVWGSKGQAHYAAANHFLDMLAHYRHGLGLPALSVNWGPWAGGGMALEEFQTFLTRMGVEGLQPEKAITALGYLLGTGCVQTTVANVDWRVFKELYEARGKRLILEQMGGEPQKAIAQQSKQTSEIVQQLAATQASERQALLTSYLQRQAASVLKLPQLPDSQQSLFDLGMDSLMAVELVNLLRSELQVELPVMEFMQASSIAALVVLLLKQFAPDEAIVEVKNKVLNLQDEAVLDDSIYPDTTTIELTEPNSILLTGATGFLGAFLLKELLAQTEADIYCLVRASDAELGLRKIQNNLESYLLWKDDYSSRIIPVVGDLSQPRFGLSLEQFETLARNLDIIYHNGAVLNFVYPYSALKPTNVLGTQEILRLACKVKIKPLHYVSTDAVFDSSGYYGTQVKESEPILHTEGIDLGYTQTKWVAEKLVTIARDRGLPVSIYRPPLIAGNSQNGFWNTDDFTCRFIKGCIQMGSMPNMNCGITIVPVDYVSKAVVHLSRQNESLGKAFHLNNPHYSSWNEVADWIDEFGYPVRQIPYEEWEAELIEIAGSGDNALSGLVPFFLRRWSEEELTFAGLGQRRVKLNCEETVARLAGTSISCPRVDSKLLNTYFSHLIRSGFLDAPKVRV